MAPLPACGGTENGGRPAHGADVQPRVTVTTSDKRQLSSDLGRGHVTGIFLFATFDGASQLQVRTLNRVVGRRPDVCWLGVASQPKADRVLAAWVDAVKPRFPVGVPREAKGFTSERVTSKRQVPTLFVLRHDGVLCFERSGFVPLGPLEQALSECGAPGPNPCGALSLPSDAGLDAPL